MQRINTTNAVPNLFGTGKPGFADGVPGLTPATYLNAAWFNSLQEEIANLIEFAAIALNGNDRTQLRQAVNSLITSALATHRTQSDALYAAKTLPVASEVLRGIVELASNAEALAGADTSRAVTPASLAAVLAGHFEAADPHPQYRNAANLNAGTIPEARLPLRLQATARQITDWNEPAALENGWFMTPSGGVSLNSPNSNLWWIGQTFRHNAIWQTQTIWAFSSNNDASNTMTYRRECNNGTWSDWERCLVTKAEQDANILQLVSGQRASRFYFAHC